jgi:branched-chain amino acid transport system substrate-binding protein
MISRSKRRSRRLLAGVFGFALVAAACGSSDDSPSAADAPAETVAEAPADTTAEAPADTTAEAPADTTAEAPADTTAAPSGEATGEPFRVGVQNLEGDPNGSFPEFSIAMQAAAKYVNAELGGLNGRPIEIVLCKSIVSPDD